VSGNGKTEDAESGAGAPGAVALESVGAALPTGVNERAGEGKGKRHDSVARGGATLIVGVSDSSEPPSRWGVLRHKHFRNVWAAALVSNTGGWMEMLGVQMIVAHETGSLKMAGYLAAAQMSPILVLGLAGGIVADRVNRRTLLVVTQVMLMVIAVALAAVSYFGAPPMGWMLALESDMVAALMVLSVVQGIVMSFNMPAWQVLTPRLVPRSELTKAITLNGVQFNMARVVGPAAGGWILAASAGSATPLFIINAITFMAVVVAVITTPDAPAPPRPARGEHPWKQLGTAFAFVLKNKGPLCVFAAMILMSLLAAPLVRMLPLYAIDVYGLSQTDADRAVGNLLAVLGLGAVVGWLLLRWMPPWYPKHHFIPMSLCGAGLTICVFATTGTLGWGYFTMFFCGVFWIWGFNQAWAAMQHLVEDSMRGRVMATANVASFGATAVGTIGAGWLGESIAAATGDRALGTHLAVGVLAAVLLVAGVAMLLWRVPEVDGPEVAYQKGTNRRSLLEGLTALSHRPRDEGEGSEKSEPSSGEVA